LPRSDEGPREDTTPESLAPLRAAFMKDGAVTAGNSISLNDGVAAVSITSRTYAAGHGLKILATVRSIANAGVSPGIMGIGPVPATEKALRPVKLTLDQIGLIELNEAFAAQSLAVLREWGIDGDDPRLNVSGGAIALGHPLGCSGARPITTIVHEFGHRRKARYARAAMCIGVGQGIAMVLSAETD
jgi:acetyl-CoA acyltransferase